VPAVMRASFRFATFVVSFVVAGAFVWIVADRILSARTEASPIIGLDLVEAAQEWRHGLEQDRQSPCVALLGDSVLAAPLGETALPEATREALARLGEPGRKIKLCPFGWPGWGVSGQYFLADEIVRARPDRIALELNLRALGPATAGTMSYPELAGWLETSHLWEAASLPLSYAGLTLDRLLFYRLLAVGGVEEEWANLLRRQARLFSLREPLEVWVDQATGEHSLFQRRVDGLAAAFNRAMVPGKRRLRTAGLEPMLGEALGGIEPGHPRLRILKATLDRYRRAGIPTLVWVAPTNIEHLRSLGLSLTGIDRSMTTLRQLVESSGAMFADFHALLPDKAFRDEGDHTTSSGESGGVRVLAEELAVSIVRLKSQPVPSSPHPPIPPRDGAAHVVQ
jgi:hypothetical protein